MSSKNQDKKHHGFLRKIFKPKIKAPCPPQPLLDPSLKPFLEKENLTVVQIGSNDGRSNNDPLYPLINRNKRCRGILVEPMPHLMRQLKKTYRHHKGLSFVQAAVSDKDEKREFYYIPPHAQIHPHDQLLGTLSRSIMLKHKQWLPDVERHIKEISVPCFSLKSLLERHQISSIDIFHVDAEGWDYKILKQLDFKKYQPSRIIFEHRHMSEQEIKDVVMFLDSNGYSINFLNRFDAICQPYPKRDSSPFGVVDYQGEFGPELQICIPYAYFLYTKGLLKKTVSAADTKCFYYFSPEHEERYSQRSDILFPSLPNRTEHLSRLDKREWKAPPYAKIYQNERFKWSREAVVISNKYNTEWGGEPANFIDNETLEKLFKQLSPHYQIIYNRPGDSDIVSDNSTILDLKEPSELLKKYQVLTMQDLFDQAQDLTFNELQMRVMANCRKFISVQGGNSVLASYFGGTNIVYMVRGREIRCGDYDHYGDFSGTQIVLCENYEKLLSCAADLFVEGVKTAEKC